MTPPIVTGPATDKERSQKRIYFVSLGCPKNRVDSEVMLGTLLNDGYTVVSSPQESDVIVVNTCSFVEEAKEESIDTILEMVDLRSQGGQKLVVSGCLAQRYHSELVEEMPEVDLFIGTGEYHRIADLLAENSAPRVAVGKPYYVSDHLAPRVLTTPQYSAYLRIAEGCSQRCTFCIIPQLRGKARSRPIDSVVAEARALAAQGVREVNLIAQDLTHYGDDLKEENVTLARLLRQLVRVDGLSWIRLMYCYPHNFTDELVELIATEDKICKYIDMPLQHIHDDMLSRMQRRTTEKITRDLLTQLRAVPDLVLRTTFIVGHPGETEIHFRSMCDFIQEFEFDRLGVFKYSQEEGTRSARQTDMVPNLVKLDRYHRLMELQQGISAKRMAGQVGRTMEVLVEGVSDETELLLQGRTYGQAPEIDGVTYINEGCEGVRAGDIRLAEIVDAGDYDFVARLLTLDEMAEIRATAG